MSAARTLAVAATRTSFTAPPSTFVRTRPFMQAFSLSRPLQLQSNHTFSSHGTLFSPNFTLRHSRGMCQLAQAIKGDVDDLLRVLSTKMWLRKCIIVYKNARWVSSRRDVVHTDFLTPPVLKDSMIALEKLADVKTVAQGGYPQAERCRISVGHPEALTSDPDVVAALSITGNFGFQPCSHGDFLGAILGTGIAREKLGDIILQGEKGAQILVVPELVDYLISSLDKDQLIQSHRSLTKGRCSG